MVRLASTNWLLATKPTAVATVGCQQSTVRLSGYGTSATSAKPPWKSAWDVLALRMLTNSGKPSCCDRTPGTGTWASMSCSVLLRSRMGAVVDVARISGSTKGHVCCGTQKDTFDLASNVTLACKTSCTKAG